MKITITTIALCIITSMTFGQSFLDSSNYYVQKANGLPKENHSQKIAYLDKAIEFCKQSNMKTLLFMVVPNRINEYIAINELELAEKDYLWLLEEHKQSPFFGIGDIYWGLANLYRDSEKYNQAIENYKSAITSNGTIGKFIVYLDYSKCLTKNKNYDEAIANINNGLKSLANNDPNVIQINYYKSKNNIPAEYFLLMFERASIYFKADKKKEGCNDLDEIVKLLEIEADIFNTKAKAIELRNKECK
ncbi:MAG TPA: hypothetical protein PK649_04995 [Vicingus sp.]|nr:hypothetical protein [Vicingus sp.]